MEKAAYAIARRLSSPDIPKILPLLKRL